MEKVHLLGFTEDEMMELCPGNGRSSHFAAGRYSGGYGGEPEISVEMTDLPAGVEGKIGRDSLYGLSRCC